jgi:DeoR family glycerol-3-phosphate regulon repressor
VRGGHISDCHHFFTEKQIPPGFHRVTEQSAGKIHVAGDGRVQAA